MGSPINIEDLINKFCPLVVVSPCIVYFRFKGMFAAII